jgi:DNA-binding NtrC family response regulator
MPRHVLILDPPGGEMAAMKDAIAPQVGDGCVVCVVRSMRALLSRLRTDPEGCVCLLDEKRGDGRRDGLALVAPIRRVSPMAPVVVVADQGDVHSAARAIDAGATDFLVRGDNLPQRVATLMGKLRGLLDVVDRNRALGAQNADLRDQIEPRFRMVGRSAALSKLIDQVKRVAPLPRPVLIVGERGTGKELVARAIHDAGGDPARPIVTANCAAFTDTLLESELFGHEKGAFTGADHARVGKFEQANGGTLFLDEVGHMSLPFQQKVLRVVEYGCYTPVGQAHEKRTTARIIAATNIDLKARIDAGRFLPDLYDRLAFEVVHVPPLRQRKADIEGLARHFLAQFAREIPAFAGKTLSRAAVRLLNAYAFPGNVRELKNIIERAAYRDTTNEITPDDIGMLAPAEMAEGDGGFAAKVNAFRRRLLLDAMNRADNNQAQAARDLSLSYHQFRYYYKTYVG